MVGRALSERRTDAARGGLFRLCDERVSGGLREIARPFVCRYVEAELLLKRNCRKVGRAKLKEGDLVFFRTGRGKRKVPNHVGIYLKNGKFIHASTSRGVIVSSLSEPYYVRTWLTGGRVK